jgi:hypothetical protein
VLINIVHFGLLSSLQGGVSIAMLGNMKNNILNSLLIFSLIASQAVSAALYKGLDAEGKVVYSDTPFEAAEKFTPPPLSVMDKPKVSPESKADVEEKPAEFKYLSFDIVSPTNKQTIRNEPDVTVTLNLKPGLNSEQGHSIWMLVDGNPVIKESQDLILKLGRLERGAHMLQAQIRDQQGKIVARTRSSGVFIHQSSAP